MAKSVGKISSVEKTSETFLVTNYSYFPKRQRDGAGLRHFGKICLRRVLNDPYLGFHQGKKEMKRRWFKGIPSLRLMIWVSFVCI